MCHDQRLATRLVARDVESVKAFWILLGSGPRADLDVLCSWSRCQEYVLTESFVQLSNIPVAVPKSAVSASPETFCWCLKRQWAVESLQLPMVQTMCELVAPI